jgi:hypothetical protein
MPNTPRRAIPTTTPLRGLAVGCALVASAAASAQSQINLNLVGPTEPVSVGQVVEIRLRASSELIENFVGTSFVAIDCILGWDPAHLKLLGLTTAGSVPLLSSYFPNPTADYTGINESNPPQDGDALYYALAPLGNPVQCPAFGVQVTTFRFQVLSDFASTAVEIIPTLTVDFETDTIVYDGTVPGLDVLGTATGWIVVQQTPCPGDLDGNGVVDAADLATLLANWGASGAADIDGSGAVDGADLATLLASWGNCGGA